MMSHPQYPKLFQPGKIGGVTVPNRVFMAPMGECRAVDRYDSVSAAYFAERAKGGCGMILTESTLVVGPDTDPYSSFKRVDSTDKIHGLADVAEAIRRGGAVPCIQFSAGQGRNAGAPDADNPPWAPSPVPTHDDPSVICREITAEEIADLVKAFGRAAKMAHTAGFAVCNLMCHGGYLAHSFLSAALNRRTDRYGGSAENRFRFLREIREEIMRCVPEMPMVLRLGVEQCGTCLLTLEESLEYCELAEAAGYDAIDVDRRCYVQYHNNTPSPYEGQACFRHLSRAVKERVSIPVIVVGGILEPAVAEEVLASGDADFVMLGRPLLADPEWVNKARRGREDEIRSCIQCNEKCLGNYGKHIAVTCAVNPLCGKESRIQIQPAERKKRVTVVGGGPAGMQAALLAARRGHRVILLEQSNSLGGQLKLAVHERFKAGLRGYLRHLTRSIELSAVEVRLGCAANLETIRATEPDAVVWCAGADIFKPGLPGFDDPRVVTVRELYEMELPENARMVVIGGGLIGMETALGFAMEGRATATVVEMLDDVLTRGVNALNKESMLAKAAEYGVAIHTSTAYRGIEGDELVAERDGEELRIPFDVIVAATGTRARDSLNERVLEAFPEVYVIGDCAGPANVAEAVHQAFYTGLRI